MSAALMFPNTPHTSTMSAGTSSAYQWACEASPSTIRIRSATPGGGGTVPGEGDEGRIELDQQRRDLRTPWMGRHDVDDVPPLACAEAHDPDGLSDG